MIDKSEIVGRLIADPLTSNDIADYAALHPEMFDELGAWLRDGVHLQKIDGSQFHKLREHLRSSNARRLMSSAPLIDERDALSRAEIFLIEHDWASALDKASGVDGGEIKLPYDVCAFEARISGKRVITVMTDTRAAIFVQMSFGWCIPRLTYRNEGEWDWQPFMINHDPKLVEQVKASDQNDVAMMIFRQVRAMAIVLDAEVCTREIVRAPHRLNAARIKRGALPIYDYHVVRLHRRDRPAPLEDGEHGERRSPRMHFVRGHWRHFTSYKTWIRWHFRGDPAGFVDKEYRL